MTQSLQDRYSPDNTCFGCGPANDKGLRIKSFVEGDEVVAEWRADSHHNAFLGMLNGGIIGALLDCHSNWAATWYLMQESGAETPPCTVTAEYRVVFKRPTPIDGPIKLRAWVTESSEDRVDALLRR